MQVERVQAHKYTFYRIHSEKDALEVEPRELIQLLTWLQVNEPVIIGDALQNDAVQEQIEKEG